MPLTDAQKQTIFDAVKETPCGSGGVGSRGVRPGYDLYNFGPKMRNLSEILMVIRERGIEASTAKSVLAAHQAVQIDHYPLGTIANLMKSHFWCDAMAEEIDGEVCYRFPAEPFDPKFLFSVWGSKLPFDLMILAIAGSNGNGTGNGHASPAPATTTGGTV